MATVGQTLYESGLACERAGDMEGAFEAFRRSAKADPRIAAPFVGLSRLLLRNHQRSQAIACLERAVACEPRNATVHTLLGQALAQDGQLDTACGCFENARRLDPLSPAAALGLAAALEDLGARAKAVDVYREVLGREPGDAEALAGLLGVTRDQALDDAIGAAANALGTATDQDAALIGYALGKALTRTGDHARAFDAWAAANQARRRRAGGFDRETFDRRIDRLIEIFSRDFFAARGRWGSPTDRPVFIVGLPRSGTTLVEQILSGHPAVFGAGELDLLTDLATGTPDRLGRRDLSWPETAPALDQEQVLGIARDHADRLAAIAPPDAGRVIDKQPLNFWHVGLVALCLPGARIIHCTRDIRDNGLSIFAENFTPEQRWATDLSDIAAYWRGYRRLMAHWRTATDLEILDVAYEDVVADIEGQARRMTQHLGLTWTPAVLPFHETKRAVQTPSKWQVRQSLYTSSAGRWRQHEQRLGPLIAASGTNSADRLI